ncbi:MAG: lytic murein transglycosylase [Candidatus Moranbacteria bacterium]|nr:lytic murein transglycosylase [Candidatus Moranbacteria bacterium]
MYKQIRILFLLFSFGAFSALCFVVPTESSVVLAQSDCDDTDTGCINDRIDSLEKKLKDASKKKSELEKNLNQINTSLTSTQQVIQRTQVLLNESTQTIEQKEKEVAGLEQQLTLEKSVLKGLLRELYESSSIPFSEIIVAEKSDMRFFHEYDTLFSVQEKIQGVIGEINTMKEKVTGEKETLEDMKKDQERLLALKNQQKKNLVLDKVDTQGDIEDQQTIISRLKKELDQLQGDLDILSGKSYDAKDIREAVEFASKKTGVPVGVLYGFLKKETNIGVNTGQCTYKQVESVSVARYKSLLKKNKNWQKSIDLLYKRKALFYDIVDVLGYSKDKKVSCSPSPSAYIGQGGAMGIPQFMSDVWMGYKSRITANTGHKNPDPWNITDGVMAMALKLRVAGATSSKESVIKSASINYLGTFNKNYYEGIVYWSKNYKLLFQ